ncbi:MAG TPA: phospholipase D-like domain-containing protein [Vicinamibacterales bacterium]|nr:phospholipase D-like domain-containing protein [Vicinamibacterales bacterium]
MKLIIQPEAGVMPVVTAIRAARRKIDIFIFRFDRDEIEQALAHAVQRGVTVRALIAHTNRGGEARLRKLEQRLLASGVLVSRTSDELTRYHAKYMVADSVLHLFGFNFTRLDIDKSRSFAISTRDGRAVQEATRLFESDVLRQPYTPGASNLVISPDNARKTLASFIRGARRELAIYDAKVRDLAMIKLLKERAAKGVTVRVLGSVKGKEGGIDARAPNMRLHVRAIVRDGTRAFVGSQSLRIEELDQRREVGLIITNPTVARKLLQVFESDWADAVKSAKTKKAA